MTASWRVAESLQVLLAEVNASAPRRSKASDGSIGDAAHASHTSDHNPWVKDGTMGVVRARDFTHDPKGGFDAYVFAEKIRQLGKVGHPALASGSYVISNHRIASHIDNWAWRPYNGVNAHTHHTHVSVGTAKSSYDSHKSWRISIVNTPSTSTTPSTEPVAKVTADPDIRQLQQELNKLGEKLTADGIWGKLTEAAANKHIVRLGSVGPSVTTVQNKLRNRGWSVTVDGKAGAQTINIVKTFQREKGLKPDGIVGARTWLSLYNARVTNS